jgi:hypothetical protein
LSLPSASRLKLQRVPLLHTLILSVNILSLPISMSPTLAREKTLLFKSNISVDIPMHAPLFPNVAVRAPTENDIPPR